MRPCSFLSTQKINTQEFDTPKVRPLWPYHPILLPRITKAVADSKFQPVQSPGKDTYGDLDFLVFEPLQKEFDPKLTLLAAVAENIGKALDAKDKIVSNGSMNFAIPYLDKDDTYIQLDVHVCSSKTKFDWQLWQEAHGDLWSILGSMIRQFGITVNETGLYLRIPEIEAFNKKKAKVFLTKEPARVLDFLGLDVETWGKPFESREAMFEYAAGCRLFWVKETIAEDELEGDVIAGGGIEGMEGGETGRKKLKSNDRARMGKRPIFRAWHEEFIPKCREEGRFGNTNTTREVVRDEAFAMFDVKEEYESKREEWKLAKNKLDVWGIAIKGSVPVDIDNRNAIVRLFKQVILVSELQLGILQSSFY